MQVATAPPAHNSRLQRPPHDPVLLVGRPSRLCTTLRSVLADHDVASVADPRELPTPESGDAHVIITTESRGPCRRGLRRWREHAARQMWEDRLTEAVVDAAGRVSGFRVLILCDASNAPSRRAAIAATRQLGQRMAYECALNGAPVTSITYLMVDDATPPTTAINAAVTWHFTHKTQPMEDRPY